MALKTLIEVQQNKMAKQKVFSVQKGWFESERCAQ